MKIGIYVIHQATAMLALVTLLTAPGGAVASNPNDPPLLLRDPSVSQTQIVFRFAGSLWIVSRDGGDARRLTTGGHERHPIFSPDGSLARSTVGATSPITSLITCGGHS